MSASQTTTNYNLPVFEPTDIPAWLTDWNSAMGNIDTAIAGAKTAADTAQLTASGAANGVSTLNTTVGNLQTTVGNQGSTITSLGNSLNTVQSLIGNGTPTTTDQTIIGAINEINAAYKDAVNIEFDNDGTGMTATNVQAAIVEAYNHGGGGGASAAADVTYDNTDSGLTATNVQDAIDELAQAGSTGLSDVLIADGSGATAADQLTSLQTAYTNMTAEEKRNAYLDVLGNHVNISSGSGYYVLVSTGGTTEGFISITNAKLFTKDTASGGATGNLTDSSSTAITMSLRTLR